MPMEDIREQQSPGAENTGNCEVPNVSAGNQACALCS